MGLARRIPAILSANDYHNLCQLSNFSTPHATALQAENAVSVAAIAAAQVDLRQDQDAQ
jgi:phosphoglycerate dehydrogenase-like enzyme